MRGIRSWKRAALRSASSLGRHALALGRLGDRLAVLVGAGQEEDLLAALAHVAGEDVGADRRVRVAEMGRRVDVVDRGGDVVGHRRGLVRYSGPWNASTCWPPRRRTTTATPGGHRAGMDRFGPKIGAAQIGGLGLRASRRRPRESARTTTSIRGEWLMPLDGRRWSCGRPRASRARGRFEVVAFPPGAAGAHKATNRGPHGAGADALARRRAEVLGVRLSRRRQGARELARGPAPVAAGRSARRLLRREA